MEIQHIMNIDCLSPGTPRGDDPDDPGSQTKGDVHTQDNRPTYIPETSPSTLMVDADLLDEDDAARLTQWIEQAIRMLPCALGRVDLAVLDDAHITNLHRRWYGLESTTDVLTFESHDGELTEAHIAICYDEAVRCRGQHADQIVDELLLYAIHGLLHCCGFNDDTPEATSKMRDQERLILHALGRGDVYAQGGLTS